MARDVPFKFLRKNCICQYPGEGSDGARFFSKFSDYQLDCPAYNNGDMDNRLDLAGWTTGSANYIRLYTPTASTEVGTSQRHSVVAGTGFRLAPVDATRAEYNIIYLKTGYVRIEGIQIDGSGLTTADYARGITVLKNMSNVGDIRIDSSIIHDLDTSAGTYARVGSFGIWDLHDTTNAGPPMTITNNLIYDVYGNIDAGHIGGMLIGSRTTSYVYNNTAYNIFNEGGAVNGGAAWGIYAKAWPSGTGSATVIAKSNYCGLVSAPQDPEENCFDAIASGILTQSYNISAGAMFKTTGATSPQTIDVQFRAVGGSFHDGIDEIRTLAFMIPDPASAEIPCAESLADVIDISATLVDALQVAFPSSSAGNDIWMANGFHHEGPGGASAGGFFPDDETNTTQQESDESYSDQPPSPMSGYVNLTHFEERNLTTGAKTSTLRHLPDSGSGSERRGLSMLLFRSDVFQGVETADDATATTTTSTSLKTKVSLTTATQASARTTFTWLY